MNNIKNFFINNKVRIDHLNNKINMNSKLKMTY